MSLYWREGGSPELHMPDMLSRALELLGEYDGSKTPDLQGYEGPYYGPLELFTRPVEPNVTWHIDFITGLKEVNNYGVGMLGVATRATRELAHVCHARAWLRGASG